MPATPTTNCERATLAPTKNNDKEKTQPFFLSSYGKL